MQFSAMVLNMSFPDDEDVNDDHRIIRLAVEQSIWFARLGYHPWYTDHHFRGPWHSNPMQLAANVAPQLPPDRYIGFGLLSIPFYHPVRLVESMNQLDHLTEGKVLFGVGSGWQGTEPEALGVDFAYHASGRAAEDTLDVMQRLWAFRTGDPEYDFSVGTNSGHIKRRIMPAPYTMPHPIIIRAASREAGLIRAGQQGWPAFLGIFGADPGAQARIYRSALEEARHPPEIVETCLRWSAVDWLSVTVAETDAEARQREKAAHAEMASIRTRWIARHGKIDGPVIKPNPGESTAEAYARFADMTETIAGSPDTIAAKVQHLADVGINHLLLRFVGEWPGETREICESSARLFAQEVMPRFTDAGAANAAADPRLRRARGNPSSN